MDAIAAGDVGVSRAGVSGGDGAGAGGYGIVSNCYGYGNVTGAINDYRVDPLGLNETATATVGATTGEVTTTGGIVGSAVGAVAAAVESSRERATVEEEAASGRTKEEGGAGGGGGGGGGRKIADGGGESASAAATATAAAVTTRGPAGRAVHSLHDLSLNSRAVSFSTNKKHVFYLKSSLKSSEYVVCR